MSLDGQSFFSCEGGGCDAVFFHDGALDDCETVDSVCKHIIQAGWLPVYLRAFVGSPKNEQHVFSRGGFLCPNCAKKHGLTR